MRIKITIIITTISLGLLLAGTAYADEGRTEEGTDPAEEEINVTNDIAKDITDTVIVLPSPTEDGIGDSAAETEEKRVDPDPWREPPENDVTIGIDVDEDDVESPYTEGENDAGSKDLPPRDEGQAREPPEDGTTIGDEEKSGQSDESDKSGGPLISPNAVIGDQDTKPEPNAIAVPITVAVGCTAVVLGAAINKH